MKGLETVFYGIASFKRGMNNCNILCEGNNEENK